MIKEIVLDSCILVDSFLCPDLKSFYLGALKKEAEPGFKFVVYSESASEVFRAVKKLLGVQSAERASNHVDLLIKGGFLKVPVNKYPKIKEDPEYDEFSEEVKLFAHRKKKSNLKNIQKLRIGDDSAIFWVMFKSFLENKTSGCFTRDCQDFENLREIFLNFHKGKVSKIDCIEEWDMKKNFNFFPRFKEYFSKSGDFLERIQAWLDKKGGDYESYKDAPWLLMSYFEKKPKNEDFKIFYEEWLGWKFVFPTVLFEINETNNEIQELIVFLKNCKEMEKFEKLDDLRDKRYEDLKEEIERIPGENAKDYINDECLDRLEKLSNSLEEAGRDNDWMICCDLIEICKKNKVYQRIDADMKKLGVVIKKMIKLEIKKTSLKTQEVLEDFFKWQVEDFPKALNYEKEEILNQKMRLTSSRSRNTEKFTSVTLQRSILLKMS